MQLSEMRAMLVSLLDEDGVHRPDGVLNSSLGEGHTVMSMMTQGSEQTRSYTVDPGLYYWPLPDDFFVPVAVLWNASRLYPARMQDMDDLSGTWMTDAATTPLYYWTLGSLGPSPQMWFFPRAAAQGTLKLTYASAPGPFDSDTATPRIPTEYHQGIVWYAYCWELLKERGAMLANKALRALEEFTRLSNECMQYVYRRTPDRDYAMKPWDAEAVRRKIHDFEARQQGQPADAQAQRDLSL